MPQAEPPPGMSMSGLVEAINSNPLIASDGGAVGGGAEEDIDIDLCSSYAADLGFDSSIQPFTGDDEDGAAAAAADDVSSPDGGGGGEGSAKKKKKSKKKKKKK